MSTNAVPLRYFRIVLTAVTELPSKSNKELFVSSNVRLFKKLSVIYEHVTEELEKLIDFDNIKRKIIKQSCQSFMNMQQKSWKTY